MIIDIKQLTKTFIDGNKKLNVLKDINLQIEEGSIVTIKGPSGSGKSTLLSIIGTLDSADSGEFSINGKKIQDELNKEKIDKNQINKLFEYFDLKDRMKSFPNDLSGGEKQRVAVMRAIINNPSVIIADEPTGNLDKENVLKMISLFQKLNTEKKLTIIIATHDENVFDIGHKKYQLVDGSLEIN